MSVRLYVKLPKAELEKEGFEKMFTEFEPSFTTKLIKERKKNECRGFGFVTVPTDEDADLFISKYNNQVFVYNDEPFKEEDGTDFILVIEKALPRTKSDKEENSTVSEGAEDEESNPEKKVAVEAIKVDTVKPSRREGPKKDKEGTPKKARTKGSGGAKPKSDRPASVSESSQPDPRWANELSKLKEMFAAQTSN
jgi:RNA recognition motif-containing protein